MLDPTFLLSSSSDMVFEVVCVYFCFGEVTIWGHYSFLNTSVLADSFLKSWCWPIKLWVVYNASHFYSPIKDRVVSFLCFYGFIIVSAHRYCEVCSKNLKFIHTHVQISWDILVPLSDLLWFQQPIGTCLKHPFMGSPVLKCKAMWCLQNFSKAPLFAEL